MKLLLFPLLLGTVSLTNAASPVPGTPKKPVFNEYHGVKVEDDYQWLEKDADPAVKAWSAEQNTRTRAYLDKLPDRAAIAARLTKLYSKASPTYSSMVARPGRLFAMKFQPPKQQPMLVTLASADDLKSEKIILDPNQLDAKGTTAIDWFVPSLDGKKVAVSLSKGGSEDGDLHFYDVETAKALPDTIAHVQFPTAGGSAAWNEDGIRRFLHPLPAQRRASRGGSGFLSTDLFPQTRHRRRQGYLLVRQRFPPHRRDRARQLARRSLRARGASRMAMAAITRITSTPRMANGSSSRNFPTRSSWRISAGTMRSISFREPTRRAAKFCASRSIIPIFPPPTVIVPAGEAVVQQIKADG